MYIHINNIRPRFLLTIKKDMTKSLNRMENGLVNGQAQFHWKPYFTIIDLFCRYKSDKTRTLPILITCNNAFKD